MTPSLTEALIIFILAVIASLPAWVVVFILRRREPERTRLVDGYTQMERTIADLSTRLRQMEKDREADHREIIRLQSVISEQANGLEILTRQVLRLGETPEYRPAQPASPVNRIELKKKMVAMFNLDELNDLAFNLGIDTGELGAETTTGKATAIVRYMDRRNRMSDLIQMLAVLRPSEAWE